MSELSIRKPMIGIRLLCFVGRDRLISFASPLVLLLLWEALARACIIDVRFFPAPTSIFATMVTLLKSNELSHHTVASLQRLALGSLIGGVPALLLGLSWG